MRIHGIRTIICVVAAGVALGVAVTLPSVLAQGPGHEQHVLQVPGTPSSQMLALQGGPALAYARALQEGNCEEVIALTAWMNDRVRRISLQAGGARDLHEVREQLCDQIRRRPVEGNMLRPEGIEDEYVFAPGAQLEVSGVDNGRDDLDRPVSRRVWLRVTYPRRATAPLAPTAGAGVSLQPVRVWTVGVNLSAEEGFIVKASVIGNLEIDRESIAFDWREE